MTGQAQGKCVVDDQFSSRACERGTKGCEVQHVSSAAKKYDRSKVEEGDRRIVGAMLNHTRPVESAATTDPTAGLFHLRNGFYFGRDGDDVVIAHRHPALERDGVAVVEMVGVIRVPVPEWASVVASTMVEGETSETYQACVALLNAGRDDG